MEIKGTKVDLRNTKEKYPYFLKWVKMSKRKQRKQEILKKYMRDADDKLPDFIRMGI